MSQNMIELTNTELIQICFSQKMTFKNRLNASNDLLSINFQYTFKKAISYHLQHLQHMIKSSLNNSAFGKEKPLYIYK